MNYKFVIVLLSCSVFASLAFGAGEATANSEDLADDVSNQGSVIIHRYLEASQFETQTSASRAPLQVEIEASVPKWNEWGHMKALRKISEVGRITYRVLGFQGDSSIKNQVIGRYLQAEQQGHDDQSLTLTPANYKFRFKSKRRDGTGRSVFVFQVMPLKKRVGLYRGELWLDSSSYLPVMEKGILVRNPSLFFRQVIFERDFAIRDGAAVPAHMSSVINTRLVGRVNLSVAYSSPSAEDLVDEVPVSRANPSMN